MKHEGINKIYLSGNMRKGELVIYYFHFSMYN
jgi:hypothetical protein